MYAKVFTQIFDSSIAENYKVRHVFEDLLKLADREGCVDMTPEAIARRTNVPLDEVRFALVELGNPDKRSRSREADGRRILPLDSRRDWGWQIVNYEHYREIQDEETRKACFRDSKRKQRAKAKIKKMSKGGGYGPLKGEAAFLRCEGDQQSEDLVVNSSLPESASVCQGCGRGDLCCCEEEPL